MIIHTTDKTFNYMNNRYRALMVIFAGLICHPVFSQTIWQYSPTDTSSSGNGHYGLELTPTLNQSSTAGFTDLFINRTETAVGSGSQYFEDFQVGGSDKWILDHAGTVTLGVWNGSAIGIGYGGTGQTTASAAFNALSPLTTLGDLLYGGVSGAATRLAGNTTSTKQFLFQTGTGSASAAPAWGGISAADLPVATTSVLGGVIVPTSGNLTVDGSGNISVPTASTSTLGVVKVDGTSITISSGVISTTPNFQQSVVPIASEVTCVNGVPKTVTSLTLAAGTWEIWGVVDYDTSSATIQSYFNLLSTTTNSITFTGVQDNYAGAFINLTGNTNSRTPWCTPRIYVTFASSTTVYLVADCGFSAGTVKAYGTLNARQN
jgi:hypothetical protein